MCTARSVLYALRALSPVNRLDFHVHDSSTFTSRLHAFLYWALIITSLRACQPLTVISRTKFYSNHTPNISASPEALHSPRRSDENWLKCSTMAQKSFSSHKDLSYKCHGSRQTRLEAEFSASIRTPQIMLA